MDRRTPAGTCPCHGDVAVVALAWAPAPASGQVAEERPLPEWYAGAKFGIFVHWGPYSVRGWAEPSGTICATLYVRGPRYYFRHNPYAAWYLNTLQIPGSATEAHHAVTYGAGFPYDGFVPTFDAGVAAFDPDQWAQLFAGAGARYFVLTTKHDDGFLLWPSAVENPAKGPDYHTTRDAVGDLTGAMRAAGLRMGLYYSGGYDWTNNPTVIRGFGSGLAAIPRSQRYADDVTAHYTGLIDRYQPDLLWNDIALPSRADLGPLLDRYYAAVPDSVVNDRFSQGAITPEDPLSDALTAWILQVVGDILDRIWMLLPLELRQVPAPKNPIGDFSTTEYQVLADISDRKWEATRGIGVTFECNQTDGPPRSMTTAETIHHLADDVSKNGNLLLGVGPRADGSFPDWQVEVLEGVGGWLDTNGDAIYESVPWDRAEGRTGDGDDVRFTTRPDANTTFAVVFDEFPAGTVVLEDVTAAPGSVVTVLGDGTPLAWSQSGPDLAVELPSLDPVPAYRIAIS